MDDVLLELCPADDGLDCELALDPWPLVEPADWLELVSWLWATTNALASSITATSQSDSSSLALLFSFLCFNCVDPQSFPLSLVHCDVPDRVNRGEKWL